MNQNTGALRLQSTILRLRTPNSARTRLAWTGSTEQLMDSAAGSWTAKWRTSGFSGNAVKHGLEKSNLFLKVPLIFT